MLGKQAVLCGTASSYLYVWLAVHVSIDHSAVGWHLWVVALWLIAIFVVFSHLFWNFIVGMCYFYNWNKAVKVFFFLILWTLHFLWNSVGRCYLGLTLPECKAVFCMEPFVKLPSDGFPALSCPETRGAVIRGRSWALHVPWQAAPTLAGSSSLVYMWRFPLPALYKERTLFA